VDHDLKPLKVLTSAQWRFLELAAAWVFQNIELGDPIGVCATRSMMPTARRLEDLGLVVLVAHRGDQQVFGVTLRGLEWLKRRPGTRVPGARLDADGTAVGKTILTGDVVAGREGTMHAGPGSTHVDLETGRRTPLLAVEKVPPPAHAPRERARARRKPSRVIQHGRTRQKGD
jgi:hypothetical protein